MGGRDGMGWDEGDDGREGGWNGEVRRWREGMEGKRWRFGGVVDYLVSDN